MTNEERKREFAAAVLRNDGDTFKAAFAISGDDVGFALQIARAWKDDPLVLAEQERLLSTTDAKSFLPTKEQQARAIYALAMDDMRDTEERLKAHRLYAEIMGHIVKVENQSGVNILNQGVMIVRDAGSDEDWQKKVVEQQRTLTLNATSVN